MWCLRLLYTVNLRLPRTVIVRLLYVIPKVTLDVYVR